MILFEERWQIYHHQIFWVQTRWKDCSSLHLRVCNKGWDILYRKEMKYYQCLLLREQMVLHNWTHSKAQQKLKKIILARICVTFQINSLWPCLYCFFIRFPWTSEWSNFTHTNSCRRHIFSLLPHILSSDVF